MNTIKPRFRCYSYSLDYIRLCVSSFIQHHLMHVYITRIVNLKAPLKPENRPDLQLSVPCRCGHVWRDAVFL